MMNLDMKPEFEEFHQVITGTPTILSIKERKREGGGGGGCCGLGKVKRRSDKFCSK